MTDTTSFTLDADTPCLSCGYNLRGLSLDARCPECGVDIQQSLARLSLADVPARWFSAVRNGIALFVGGIIFFFLVILAVNLPALFGFSRMPYLWYLIIGLAIVYVVCRWWGVLLISENPVRTVALHHEDRHRRRARNAAHLWLALDLLIRLAFLSNWQPSYFFAPLLSGLYGISNALVVWCMFQVIADVALALGGVSRSRQARIIGWLLAAATIFQSLKFAVIWALAAAGLEGGTATNFIRIFIDIPNGLALLAGSAWALVIFFHIHRALGKYRAAVPAGIVDERSAWIPQAAERVIHLFKHLPAYAAYHGPPRN